MQTIKIQSVKNLITARPEGMDFETYKQLRKEQHQKLHGYNEPVYNKEGQVVSHRHIAGRLEGVCIPPHQWTNSRDVQIVIVKK